MWFAVLFCSNCSLEAALAVVSSAKAYLWVWQRQPGTPRHAHPARQWSQPSSLDQLMVSQAVGSVSLQCTLWLGQPSAPCECEASPTNKPRSVEDQAIGCVGIHPAAGLVLDK